MLKEMFNYKNYDVTIIENSFRGVDTKWNCGYVLLKGKLKSSYDFETFRDGNVIGVDTMGIDNNNLKICKQKIKDVIDEHLKIVLKMEKNILKGDECRKFLNFVKLQRSCRCNMLDTRCVKSFTNLDKEDVLSICENYNKLSLKYSREIGKLE